MSAENANLAQAVSRLQDETKRQQRELEELKDSLHEAENAVGDLAIAQQTLSERLNSLILQLSTPRIEVPNGD